MQLDMTQRDVMSHNPIHVLQNVGQRSHVRTQTRNAIIRTTLDLNTAHDLTCVCSANAEPPTRRNAEDVIVGKPDGLSELNPKKIPVTARRSDDWTDQKMLGAAGHRRRFGNSSRSIILRQSGEQAMRRPPNGSLASGGFGGIR